MHNTIGRVATALLEGAGIDFAGVQRGGDNQGAIRISGDDGNGIDDGSSRTKRLRVVSTFEYELR